jgi:hypothetical protein
MTTPEIIGTVSKNTNLAFLIIGGHAVIAHGYPRNTCSNKISATECWGISTM